MTRWITSLAAALATTFAAAMPMMPQRIPGDRLIQNLQARLKKNPKEALEINYLIGRAHYASFAVTYEHSAIKPGDVDYYPGYQGSLPSFGGYMGVIAPWNGSTSPQPTPDNLRHIRGAIEYLNRAIKLNHGGSALPWLTLACVHESAAPIAGKLYRGTDAMTPAQARAMAEKEYLNAFNRSIKYDQTQKTIPLFGLGTLISYEAARSYLRLAPRGPQHDEVKAALAKFDKLPPSGIVTPLIFSLTSVQPLADLLAPNKVVDFDLNGTGLPQRYSWVKPTTAFLVWDPEGAGRINSGRRLFGSATWWMLWTNAYQALDALDDNRDGWLAGSELKGLAIWIDRNQNGRSEPGEVVSLATAEIEAIATNATETQGQTPANPLGLRMRDGRMLPTYDWVTKPIKR